MPLFSSARNRRIVRATANPASSMPQLHIASRYVRVKQKGATVVIRGLPETFNDVSDLASRNPASRMPHPHWALSSVREAAKGATVVMRLL